MLNNSVRMGWRGLAVFLGLVCVSAIGPVPSLRAADKPAAGTPLWSLSPLKAPARPSVKTADWARDDLDRFILVPLEAAEVAPNADADRATLLRRVAFALTGLPPTSEELTRFLADRQPDDKAFATVVDGYLASPRFGERWARHWLDVVRYAESTGRTFNPPMTYAFRYREYVIDALNKDKPYDRFLLEQIAGDLLPSATVAERRENLIATGFLAFANHDLQNLSHEQYHMDVVDDQIDVVTRGVLGLSVACARCHDHKYDPVSMRDYYALAGIFTSTKVLPGVAYRGQGSGYVNPSELVPLPVSLTGAGKSPTLVPGTHSMSDYQAIWSTGKRDIHYTTDPNRAMGVLDESPADCALRIKGDVHDRGPAPPRGDLQIKGLPAMRKPAADASGRLELAQWLVTADNPLTPRVMANRVWQHLLGSGLVATPDDFGAVSEPPTHPELLDHLAITLRDDGWSLKRLIRRIVLSRTYRLSSRTLDNPARESDPQNRLYWRANLRRLEWEPLRDSLLAVSDELTLRRPEGIQVAGIGGKSQKSQARGLLDIYSPYRTVYLPVLRSHVPESFSTFDFPDPCQLAGRREVTTVAPQALFFMNSGFVSQSARGLASAALQSSQKTDRERITWLYKRLFAREPSPEEIGDALSLLADGQSPASTTTSGSKTSSKGGAKPTASNGSTFSNSAWTLLSQALLASAEFRYVR